jgi:hypothetical protein
LAVDISKVTQSPDKQEKPKVNIVENTTKPTDSEFECFGCGS